MSVFKVGIDEGGMGEEKHRKRIVFLYCNILVLRIR